MNRGTGNRRSGQMHGPTTAQLAQRMRGLERRLTGFKTIPRDNPPAFVALPWNSFTYEVTNESGQAGASQIITVQEILAQLATRCALATTPPEVANVRVKVQSCQVWCTVAGALVQPDIETTFYELSGEAAAASQQARSIQRDLGTLNKPAKVGYVYPSADRREIIADDLAALKVVSTVVVPAGARVTARVQVLWQSSFES